MSLTLSSVLKLTYVENIVVKHSLKKYLKNEDGNFSVVGAVGIPVTLAMSALAIETTSLHGKYDSIQSALDAATLAAATVEPNEYNLVASEIFEASFGQEHAKKIKVNIIAQDDILVGMASGTVDTVFADLLMPSTVTISAISHVAFAGDVVEEQVGERACIIVLSKNNEALRLNSNSHIVAPECEVHVHSTQDRSVVADSNQHQVSKFCLSASRLNNNNSGLGVYLNCDVAQDPYAGTVPTSIPNNCISQPQNLDGNTPRTFSPGRYCQGINVNGQADIHFEPGTYYINGNWNVNGGRWTGEGVTFVFTQNGNIQFNSNFGGMEMSAPSTGDFANLFMVDLNGQNQFILNSGNELNITGAIYMPRRQVTYNSNATTNGSAMNFVVDRLTINSNASLNIEPAEFTPFAPKADDDSVSTSASASGNAQVARGNGSPYLIR